MKRKGKYVQLEFDFKPWEDEEIWKDIPNYEGLYQASNLGRIKSLGNNKNRKEKILKYGLDGGGYPMVCLSYNGKQKTEKVHRLVYETFNGEIPEGYEINHISEDKQENKLSNLNLVTHKANCDWGTRNERIAKAHNKSVIQKSLDGKVVKVWSSLMEIQRKLGYSYGNISECCNGNRKTAYKYLWQYEEAV